MELGQYLRIIQKGMKTVIGCMIVLAVIASIWAATRPVKYQATSTLSVKKQNAVTQQTASYYQYDEFYAIQSSGFFSEALTAIMRSPGAIKEIYEKAGHPLADTSIQALAKAIKVRRIPPVSLEMTVTDADRDKAESIVKSALVVAGEKTAEHNRGQEVRDAFATVPGEVVIGQTKPDVVLNAILGLIAGLFLGLIIVFLAHYAKQD